MNNYFENVIGYEYVKKELSMILEVMKSEEKYKNLGAKIPKNVLLHGVPGVGKTLFANEFIKASRRKSYIIRKDKSNGDFVDYIKYMTNSDYEVYIFGEFEFDNLTKRDAFLDAYVEKLEAAGYDRIPADGSVGILFSDGFHDVRITVPSDERARLTFMK